MTTFALDLSKAIEAAKDQSELIVKRIAIDLFSNVVLKSPVGNPELWAANKESMYMRETHNTWIDQINADLYNVKENLTKKGNLKKGVKKAKRLSKKALLEEFALKAGKGYVGGRFRANWVVSFNAPSEITTKDTDKTGTNTINKIRERVGAYTLEDGSIFMTNSLPYAQRLEEGYSTQAPVGMVRLSVLEANKGYGA
jgi:hypothetical protein